MSTQEYPLQRPDQQPELMPGAADAPGTADPVVDTETPVTDLPPQTQLDAIEAPDDASALTQVDDPELETAPEADDRTPVPTPDTTTQTSGEPKGWVKFAAPIALLATIIAGGGAVLAQKGNSSSDTPAATASAAPGDDSETVPAEENIYLNEGGNVHPAVLEEGEEFITAQRLGGAEVNIPAGLRELDPANPLPFVNSVMALYVGYINTGDERILSAFSSDPEVQGLLRVRRDAFMTENTEEHNYGPVQQAVFDSPANPAQFTVTNETADNGQTYQVVRLSGGNLFLATTEDNRWQGPESNAYQGALDTLQFSTDFRILYATTADGTPTIAGFHYEADPVAYENTVAGIE